MLCTFLRFVASNNVNTTMQRFSLFLLFQAELRISPRSALVRVGDSTIFRCQKEPNAELPIAYWMHRPLGKQTPTHIYSSALEQILDSYELYVSVRNNRKSGQYDLVMKNIQLSHAGTYYCVDSNEERTTVESDLTVINGIRFKSDSRTNTVCFCIIN